MFPDGLVDELRTGSPHLQEFVVLCNQRASRLLAALLEDEEWRAFCKVVSMEWLRYVVLPTCLAGYTEHPAR